jgi:biotin-dependent carboxylase-like uncharacterized protein
MIRDIGYIKVIKSRLGTSIQDEGRFGLSELGVPTSGAMDDISFKFVNHLLKNKPTSAALEISSPGVKLRFESPTVICLAGALAEITLNGKSISLGIHPVSINDELEIGAFLKGSILYLGIKDGFQSGMILNSRSYFAGITTKSQVQKEDRLPYFTNQEIPNFTASHVKWNLNWAETSELEVYPGPEWELLSAETRHTLTTNMFTISIQKTRMGIMMEEPLENFISEMATAPVYPGTVQLTSGGKMFILMRDAQVTGGYPRILQLPENSISILSQKKFNEKIKFKLISI